MRRFAHGAARRIQKERSVIRFAIVITGHAEPERKSQDQKRGRIMPPMVRSVDQRRVKRRKIRAHLIKFPFEGAQRGVQAKSTQKNDHRNVFHPPCVATQRAAQTARYSRASALSQTSPPWV